MSTVAETRVDIADTLNARFPELNVVPHPESASLTPGDGFVSFVGPTIQTAFPGVYDATFEVLLVIANDLEQADRKLDDLTAPVMNVFTQNFRSSAASADFWELTAGDEYGAGVVYALRITVTMEVN